MIQMRTTKQNPRQNPVPPIRLNPLLISCTPIRKRNWSLRNRKKSITAGSLCYQINFLPKTSSWTGSTYNRNRTLSFKVLASSMHSYKNSSKSQTKNIKSTQNSTQSKPENPKTLKQFLMILNELYSFNFLKNKLKITFERGTTRSLLKEVQLDHFWKRYNSHAKFRPCFCLNIYLIFSINFYVTFYCWFSGSFFIWCMNSSLYSSKSNFTSGNKAFCSHFRTVCQPSFYAILSTFLYRWKFDRSFGSSKPDSTILSLIEVMKLFFSLSPQTVTPSKHPY